MEIQRGNRKLGFHPYFDIRHNQDARLLSSRRRPHFTPKEIPWYLFLLDAEWKPVLLNADRKIRSLSNFQGPYRESNTVPPALWLNQLTDRPRIVNSKTTRLKSK